MEGSNFIRNQVIEDIEKGITDKAITRFPPEPNGLLHIGHAKAITINFDISEEFNGHTYLRFDDTNPTKEDERFVELIKEDIQWLGFEWKEVRYASDYFDEMIKQAHILIDKGLAYVDETPYEEMKAQRGDWNTPGVENEYRDRPIEESRELFNRMEAGEFEEGAMVLRAKIDMQSGNYIMRDPVIYRIVKDHHFRQGDKYSIYPMYDFAHPLEDAVEGITHSLCSLEFENNRPLYDWVIEHTEMKSQPHQYEFAKLNIPGAILGKRNILKLVADGLVDGWDDPRLLTISGMRRRGYTPDGIKNFIRETGVSKENSMVDFKMLEHFIREDLKLKAKRVMSVLDPLKVTITNMEGLEYLEAENNPENEALGSREIPFSSTIYIEKEDFQEVPEKGYKRLSPGKEVRLKYAYFIKCDEVIKDESGEVIELICSYDPQTKSGSGFKERKPEGTIHWVDASENTPIRAMRYAALIEGPFDKEKSLEEQVNKESLEELQGYTEKYLADALEHEQFQFFRHGYFAQDPKYQDKLTFNETVSLKSSFK